MTPSRIIKFYGLLFLLTLLVSPSTLSAQEEESSEPIRSRLNLSCEQLNGETFVLQALARARIDGQYTGLPGLDVEFFVTTDSSEVSLGQAVTDETGVATLSVEAESIPRDTANPIAFLALFEGNDEFEESDDDIEIFPARIVLEPMEEDSSLAVQITLLRGDEPVADEDVSLFLKRLFSPLKVGEATTDEDGMATIAFPMGFPGDAQGNLDIYAFLEEHDDFGNVKSTMIAAWGKPVSDLPQDLPRALWSPYPPIWMVLAFTVLMAAVWGHYGVIVFKLFQVKKEGKES